MASVDVLTALRRIGTAAVPRRQGLVGVAEAVPVIATLGAVCSWAIGTRQVDLRTMTDLGLATALGWQVLIAPIVVTVAFLWSLRRHPLRPAVLTVHVIALVLVLYGTVPMVEEVPGLRVAWRHTGVVDYILRNGQVDPLIDAYFNWPGFFAFLGLVTTGVGLDSAIGLAPWAAVVFNLLWIGPLLLLFRCATGDQRLVWLSVWLFYATNWIGQDYLAPQALTYFLYLCMLAILVRWFSPPAGKRGSFSRPGEPSSSARERVGLMALVIALFAAVVASHQLTPFATLAGVTALVAFRRCTARGLPMLMAVMIGAWLHFMARAFLGGHLQGLAAQVGRLTGFVQTNVATRIVGSPEHLAVVRIRLMLTAVLWGLAAVGWLRRRRSGRRDTTFALLAAAPFLLLLLGFYGGELILRVYLFSLPFVAFFAAAALQPWTRDPTARSATLATGLVCLELLTAFAFARYGNERSDYFTAAELDAVQQLYREAEPGSLLLAATVNLPWKAQGYEQYEYKTVMQLLEDGHGGDLATHVLRTMRGHANPGAYLIITRAQEAYIQAFGALPPGSLDQIDEALRRSDHVQLIYTNPDARIYELRDDQKAMT